ncbi:MAG: cupin domain-containing protein [Bacteroidetes bacterium]|nr:cupin domain-containing protein [Bacteroidota bacterium]
MDELNKGLKISVVGKLREEALVKFKEKIKKWDIALPDVEPLLLDFGLNDFYKTGLIEYWIANEVDAGYCSKYLFVFANQSCPVHRHKEKHETFYILKGKVEMIYDGKSFEMNPGDVLPVERWKYHGFTGKRPALLLEISQPCFIDDSYFENTKINF